MIPQEGAHPILPPIPVPEVQTPAVDLRIPVVVLLIPAAGKIAVVPVVAVVLVVREGVQEMGKWPPAA